MLVVRGNIEQRQAIVSIGFQPFVPQVPELQPGAAAFPMPVQEFKALIDTGAQRTCLCRSVIAKQALIHHSKKQIQNVHAVQRHYLYLVNIGLFCERVNDLSDRVGERTYYSLDVPLEVIDIADNHGFEAILGMDVLENLDLHIKRNREFTLRVS